MAIPSSGEIKMGGTGTNSIAQVKAGTDTGTPSAVQNVSLRGLSVDGVTDFNYTGGANTDIAVAGSSPDQAAPHAMSEFHGYTQTAMGSFPGLGQGYTSAAMTGSTVSSGFSMVRSHFSAQNFVQCGAFGVVGFRHTPSNGYVTIQYYSGTNIALATTYYQKLEYTGLANATWEVKYEYPNRGTYYQLSSGGTGLQYYMQFPWIATADFRSSPQSDNAQARLGDGVNLSTTNDVQFTLRATQSGTSYTAASTTFTIELIAQRGAYIP